MPDYAQWRTTHGLLRGISSNGVTSFLGVPYGGDTGGDNRFAAPPDLEPWEGVRDALRFGDSAPQVDTRLIAHANTPAVLELLYPRTGSPLEGGGMSENCLNLNVWIPDGNEAAALPVVVWLHGGLFVHGSGNESVFSGDILARAQQVIVITVTHRLGALGFLDLRDMGLAHSANAGLLDIVQALTWIKENIAERGGDPSRITLAGQSGGCAKTAAVASMPIAAGLVRRCMLMSFPADRVAEPEQSALVRDRYLDILDAHTLEAVRSLPIEEILRAQKVLLETADTLFSGDGAGAMSGFGPSIDPTDLPAHPFSCSAASAYRDMELLFGWTTHEVALLLADDENYTSRMTDADVAERLGAMRGRHLRDAHPEEPAHLLLARGLSEQIFRDPIIRIAQRATSMASRVFAYEFTQMTEVLDGLLGASHSLDLGYFFGTVDRTPLTGEDDARKLTETQALDAMGSFVRSGVPSTNGVEWTAWTEQSHEVTTIGEQIAYIDWRDVPSAARS